MNPCAHESNGRLARALAITFSTCVSLALFLAPVLLEADGGGNHESYSNDGSSMLPSANQLIGFVVFCFLTIGMIYGLTRRFPSFFSLISFRLVDASWGGLDPVSRQRMYVRWFIALRWLAVLISIVFVVLAVKVLHLLPGEVWPFLMITIGCLAGVNAIYSYVLKKTQRYALLLLLQANIDLVILTFLLHFSGGVENPLAMMMLFQVILAGILLSRKYCFVIAGVASILFGLLAWAEGSGFIQHYTFLLFPHGHEGEADTFHAAHQPLYVFSRVILQAVVHFLTAFFVTALSDRIRLNEKHLQNLTNQALSDRQLLERSLETTKTALRVLDADLRTLWENPQWKNWFSSTEHLDALDQDLANRTKSPARKCFEMGKVRITEIQLASENNDGTEIRHFLLTSAPVFSKNHKIIQVVELAKEITEQKQVQDQMMRASQLAAVGELAGHVAHEVNNPIAIISAKTNLLMHDHNGEMSEKVLNEIYKVNDLANRVARIARGLLSYSRPSPSSHSVIDVRDPIRKSLSMIEEAARSGGIRIEDKLPQKLPCIRGNAHEMEQVFMNLLLNALDAMPNGGLLKLGVLENKTSSSNASEMIQVFMEDSGSGIPNDLRKRIFHPFFSTKKDGKGTGLGLSICAGLIRSHGGEIFVDSNRETGSRFIVKLPSLQSNRK